MTYYDPHPAHVLAGDAFFESRAKIIRKLFDEDDYCKRWDLAHELLGKYTAREIRALFVKLYVADLMPDDLREARELLAHELALRTDGDSVMDVRLNHAHPIRMLVNPASRLPTSDVWGTES
tara:strand:- start:76 stop:441 length:366 start_codon:yes stop_codon:yes gene_type:complete